MKTDHDLESRVRLALRDALDRETGPDPTWEEAPAAYRVTEPDRRRTSRWTLRVLAVAALITIGGGAALLLGTPDDPPLPPPANGWIAYGVYEPILDSTGDQDIWFVAFDQEARRVIGSDTDSVQDVCPAFSPDGRSLAFGRVSGLAAEPTVDQNGVQGPTTYQDAALVIGDVTDDGQVADEVTIDLGDGLPPPCPLWSPTGDRIAFGVPQTSVINPTSSAEGSEVWIVTLADRSITVLPDLLATDLEFSPDGSLLAIASGTELVEPYEMGDPRIHLYQLASGATRTLEGTLGALTFTWAPDGSRIAYQTGDSIHELRVIHLATEEQHELTTRFGAIHGIGPVWSPDGESIVFQRCTEGGIGCNGESHDVVQVWPDDRSDAGLPREEVIPLAEGAADADGSQQNLRPYWVIWSPDGAYLMFPAWSSQTDPMLGAVPAAPGSLTDILVVDQAVDVNPVYTAGPFVPIQAWQRRPSEAASPTPAPEASTAAPSASGVGPSHLLMEAGDDRVPITVTIATPGWDGDPNGGVLCWDDVATCAGSPDGAGIFAFQDREYLVYGDACHQPTPPTHPDSTATTVDELIDAVTGDRQVHRYGTQPEDITLGGFAGKKIRLSAAPPPGDCDFDDTRDVLALFGLPGQDPARVSQGPSQIEEVWAVDVDGLIVVLIGASYADTPPNALDEMRAIIGSATFD